MLNLVQRDISEREHLIEFVFKERLESMAAADGLMFQNVDTDRGFLNDDDEFEARLSGGKKNRNKK